MTSRPGTATAAGDGTPPDAEAGSRPITRGQAIGAAAALSGAVVAGGALVGGSARLGATDARAQQKEADVLNFLLLIEYVQEGFYAEAIRRGRLRGELQRFAATVGAQEREHVALLKRRLGARALDRPPLEFGALVERPAAFRDAAVQLEETGAAAYIAEGPTLSKELVVDAARIVAVEARHAAWIRDVAGENPAPNAADPPQSAVAVVATLRREGFLQ